MGTNYYLRRNLTDEEVGLAIKLLEEKNYDYLQEILKKTKPLHIGKRSFGWKFLWETHDFRYFDKSKESINNFLKSGTITDEEGREYDLATFWNVELEGCIDEGHDLTTYYEQHPDLAIRMPIYIIDKYRMLYDESISPYGEFYIDGLRFTISKDFS